MITGYKDRVLVLRRQSTRHAQCLTVSPMCSSARGTRYVGAQLPQQRTQQQCYRARSTPLPIAFQAPSLNPTACLIPSTRLPPLHSLACHLPSVTLPEPSTRKTTHSSSACGGSWPPGPQASRWTAADIQKERAGSGSSRQAGLDYTALCCLLPCQHSTLAVTWLHSRR